MGGTDGWLWTDFLCADAAARDRLLGALLDAGSTGSEEHDTADGLRLRVYWPASLGLDAVQGWRAAAAAADGVVACAQGLQEREDWLAQWKAHFIPLRVTDRLWVCPPWDVREPAPGEHVILIEPQMAFGTGHHATTQLCLQLLEQYLKPGDAVLDVGTGSGILAIAAAKLGAGDVLGIDSDADAIENARENVRLNGVADRVRLECAVFSVGHRAGPDVVLCNVITARLLPLVPALAACAPDGLAILSGVGEEHLAALREALFAAGLSPIKERRGDGWCAMVCRAGDAG